MSPRTGRPTDNPKNVRLEIRLTQQQSDMIEECAKSLCLSKTDVIIKGVESVYQSVSQLNKKK